MPQMLLIVEPVGQREERGLEGGQADTALRGGAPGCVPRRGNGDPAEPAAALGIGGHTVIAPSTTNSGISHGTMARAMPSKRISLMLVKNKAFECTLSGL